MTANPTPDQRADELASRQHGAISHAQAVEVGLTERQIKGRIRSGRWRRATRGVYCVTGSLRTWRQETMVACLAGPHSTVASHLTAAALFRLVPPPSRPHVTVRRGAATRFQGATVHRGPLDRLDVSKIGQIPTTQPARTLVDCAALLTYDAFCDLVDDALCRRLTDVKALRAAAARAAQAPGRKGLRQLERALEVWTPGPLPGSPAEMRLIRRLHQLGFPLPERQFVIRDERGQFVARVDLAWSNRRAAVEYLGARYHGPRKWAADDAREDRITALGWTVEVADKLDLRPGSTRLPAILADLLGIILAA